MGDFKGVSEKFSVSLVSEEGYGSERIRCEIGLDGLLISSPDGSRTLRKYPLNHISRWALRGSNLVLYTKTPVDVEEHTLTLQGDDNTIRNVLDTLTCSCMQMVELLQSKDSSRANTDVTNSLTALLNGGGKPKSMLPTVEDVEFWKDPEKAGWMYSQGEVIKSWRRRWFVLKQGFLFRFAGTDVSSSSKPRGVVDLSKVTDVSEAREQTGRPNSLKLSTETGHVAYVCDSETELVEWFSALDGAVKKIVKQIAGFEDEPVPAQSSGGGHSTEWAKQLEKGFSSVSGPSRDSTREKNPMVKIVGYESPAARQSNNAPEPGNGGYGGGRLNYSNISGIAGIASDAPANSASTFSDSFAKVDYPAYPVLAPSRSGPNHDYGGSGSYSGYSQPSTASSYPQPQHSAPEQVHQGYEQSAYGPSGGYAGYGGAYQAATPYQPPSQQAPPFQGDGGASWQTHYTPEGRAYYYNAFTGSTTWDPPANMA